MKKTLLITAWALCLCIALSSCSSDDNGTNQEMGEMIEEEMMEEEMMEDTLAGNYKGTWNSTTPSITYTNFPVSAKFTVSPSDPNRILAEFFATINFTSCCSTNANDGTMTINLDGNTITSFSFIDTIVGCEGNFTGNGIIDTNGQFKIDFTGSDCDGEHVGQLILRK